METYLVLGANGQIGTELQIDLLKHNDADRVIVTDIYEPKLKRGRFELASILDIERLETLIKKYKITTMINMAAILSAHGEKKPVMTWQINVDGLLNVLELARRYHLKVFQPSSIAVFGSDIPKHKVPQAAPLHPTTMYGVTKVSGESLCQYYARRFDVDVRSVRFPGVIGALAMPGGGTTDYAVDIFHQAFLHKKYTCFLKPDTVLPMIYMGDAIQAINKILKAKKEHIHIKSSYNINALSFSPAQLAHSIQKQMPSFKINYDIDSRQDIADSWPASLDDQAARTDWAWDPKINQTDDLVHIMIEQLKNKYSR